MAESKVSLEQIENIEYLIKHGYAVAPKHFTDSFSENDNPKKILI